MLPEYLTQVIVFPRSHVTLFYAKVVDSMSKRIELVDEVDEVEGKDGEEDSVA